MTYGYVVVRHIACTFCRRTEKHMVTAKRKLFLIERIGDSVICSPKCALQFSSFN